MVSESMTDVFIPDDLQAMAADRADGDEREKCDMNVGIAIDEPESTIDFHRRVITLQSGTATTRLAPVRM